jgi:hypothetical protein
MKKDTATNSVLSRLLLRNDNGVITIEIGSMSDDPKDVILSRSIDLQLGQSWKGYSYAELAWIMTSHPESSVFQLPVPRPAGDLHYDVLIDGDSPGFDELGEGVDVDLLGPL